MTWVTDRDAARASATTAGSAVAAMYTSMKSALSAAQSGAGTGGDVPGGMGAWEQDIGLTMKAAIIAAGVQPADLKRILRYVFGQWRV
jgi:hypothetical protein